MITTEHVEKRFNDFVEKYRAILSDPKYKYSQEDIDNNVAHMQKRLNDRDFKKYGNKPIHLLHAGKRVVRNAIRTILLTNPARKSLVQKWRTEYRQKCENEQKSKPWLANSGFFSFEAAYSKRLKINMANHKNLMFI